MNATTESRGREQSFHVELEHKSFELVVTENDDLELYVDNCLRKRCTAASAPVLYVWTNVELHWEEHRFVEARFDRTSRRLRVTVNRQDVLDANVP